MQKKKTAHRLINRRFFLRASGIPLALPRFESLSTRVLGAGLAVSGRPGAAIGATRPKRFVAVGNMLGFYQPEFFPTDTGRDSPLPSLLQPLAATRPEIAARLAAASAEWNRGLIAPPFGNNPFGGLINRTGLEKNPAP